MPHREKQLCGGQIKSVGAGVPTPLYSDQLHGFGLFPNLSVPQCPICAGGANNGQGSSQDNQGTDVEIGHEKCLQPLGKSALWLKTSHCPCCGWVLVGDSGPPEAGCLHQGL